MKRTYLGSLDPRFFGIKIAFESHQDFDFSTKVYSGQLGTPQLAKMRSLGQISERDLWLATAIEHELRHYHDSLITPHWLSIQALRNQCAMNTQTMLASLADFITLTDSNCVALPLCKWLVFGDRDRQMRAEAWPHAGDAPWRPIPLPIYPLPKMPPSTFWPKVPEELSDDAESFAGLLRLCTMGQDRIAELNAGRATGEWANFRPNHTYELSAIIAQLVAAHITFDDRAAHDLRHSIQRHAMRDYGGPLLFVLSWLVSCKGVGWSNVLHVANILTTWAILGPPDRTEDQKGNARTSQELALSCPAGRLAFALDVVKGQGLHSETPAKLFDFLDKAAGTTDFRSAIAWVDTMVQNKAKWYAEMAEKTSRPDFIVISKHFETYRVQRAKIMDVIRDDPGLYADPVRYMNEIVYFPRPVIRTEFIGKQPIMLYEDDPSLAFSRGVFDWIKRDDGSYIVKAFIGDLPEDIDSKTIYDYENLQVFTDTLLTGKVPSENFSAVKQLFAESNLTVFLA